MGQPIKEALRRVARRSSRRASAVTVLSIIRDCIDPLLHPLYPMAGGARAVQDMLERKVTGKVVVQTCA